MADEDDRDRESVAHLLDIGENVEPARIVERGERLVHQQKVGVDQQGAPDRDALFLAPGEAIRPARQQRAEAQQRGHRIEIDKAPRGWREPLAVA